MRGGRVRGPREASRRAVPRARSHTDVLASCGWAFQAGSPRLGSLLVSLLLPLRSPGLLGQVRAGHVHTASEALLLDAKCRSVDFAGESASFMKPSFRPSSTGLFPPSETLISYSDAADSHRHPDAVSPPVFGSARLPHIPAQRPHARARTQRVRSYRPHTEVHD